MIGSAFGRPPDQPELMPRLQSGALAYKRTPNGEVRILLVTTRRSKRWSIPKGKAAGHRSLAANAAKEAFEEAGVRGEIAPMSAGVYRTTKRTCYGEAVIEIWVYLLKVTEQVKHWPEEGERQMKWVSCAEAARTLSEPLLSSLCQEIEQGCLQS
jgi:ADP-ribose pyrophosphatase YjhB (NUDIX family)